MVRFLFVCLITLLATPLAAQVRLLETGIYCTPPRTGERTDAPGTVAGFISSIEGNVAFDVSGRTVPLQQGLSFGIRTEMKSGVDQPVRMVTKHPPMPGEGQGRTSGSYISNLPADRTHVRSFTFDYPYEMVAGTWTFEIWDPLENRLLLSVDFLVVDGPVAAVDQACTTLLQT